MFIFWKLNIDITSPQIDSYIQHNPKKKKNSSGLCLEGWVEIYNLILKSIWKCKIILKDKNKVEGPKLWLARLTSRYIGYMYIIESRNRFTCIYGQLIFNHGVKVIQCGKDNLFNNWHWFIWLKKYTAIHTSHYIKKLI